MRKFWKSIYSILFLLFCFGCHGGQGILTNEYRSSLYGNWIYKGITIAVDSIFTVYSFSVPNNLEISQSIVLNPNNVYSTHSFGSYQIPSPNLMYISFYYAIHGDSIIPPDIPGDTLIYQIDNDELHLCSGGGSYSQISGPSNQLLHSDYYRVKKFIDDSYIHDLYRFSKDSVDHFYTMNFSSDFPQSWEHHWKYRYSIEDIYLFLKTTQYTLLRGYKLYNGRLILASSPKIYKKTEKK